MKKILILTALALSSLSVYAQWKPAGGHIMTTWGEQLNPDKVLADYPRPIMTRNEWSNLNGLWNYAVVDKGAPLPSAYDGKILVPFAIESSLSGVGKELGKDKELVYQRSFTVNNAWAGKDILLHFEAVDWKTEVWVNDIKVGGHTGGYVPFCFNITSALKKGENTVTVRVWDPTDESYQPRGKQVSKPGGIWYTPVSGIWQTVWLEPVNTKHIENLRITPDVDFRTISVDACVAGGTNADLIEVEVYDGNTLVASAKSLNGVPAQVQMPTNMKLWTPDTPNLYDMKVTLKSQGKTIDQVGSYTAMRKFTMGKDSRGINRICLNDKPIFQLGPLDQGWWPDGLYTPASYEALKYDVVKLKEWGYNMIRKHIKVEPQLWYRYCDELGIIVWQDMPSGDRNPEWQNHRYFDGNEFIRSVESEANYRKEWREIMGHLYSYPCIGTWIPFNEAWGQFKTAEIAEWTKQHDPTRLVNSASGGNYYTCGDILDLHNYPDPGLYLYDPTRINVLGEYGGIGMVVKDHIWATTDRNWGYVQYNTTEKVTDEYVKYANKLYDMVSQGFSAGVYTQTSDVEYEVNGLMTYDRKVIKMDEKRIREVNTKLTHSLE